MGLDLDFDKELGLDFDKEMGLLELGEGGDRKDEKKKLWRTTVPPTPPPKEDKFPAKVAEQAKMEEKVATTKSSPKKVAPTVGLPNRPAPLKLGSSNLGTSAPVRPGTSGSVRPGTSDSQAPTRPLPPAPAGKKFAELARPSTGSSEPPNRPLPQPPLRPAALKAPTPLAMNPPTRPGTAASNMTTSTKMVGSTKRLSFSSLASNRRPIKYGKGKHSRVELNPQPSDDPDDPLNWPQWRKELNFGALLLVVAMVGVMKTIFISVNSQLTQTLDVTYTAAAALTGAPLIISSFTGVLSLMGARVWGKRPFYLVSLLLIFIGAVWNTNVGGSFAQCMAARVFQGLGWGAFDTLVLGSIHDTYFDYERCRRVAVYSIVSAASTWGAPLLGGVASQTGAGFGQQFSILSAFFVVAVPAIALGAPETVFDRAYTMSEPMTGNSFLDKSLPLAPRKLLSVETALDYAVKMKPVSYSGSLSSRVLMQVPRALVAPTTLLLFLISFIPLSALWGLTQSLSLLFSAMPFMLSTGSLGVLMTGPWLLATGVVAAFALTPWWHINFSPRLHMAAVAGGSVLAFTGILGFGLHVGACMTPPSDDNGATSMFALDYLGANVNFPALSFLLGLLAAGVYVVDSTVRPLIRRSTQFTSSNLGIALRNTADMDAGVHFWQALFAGVFVIAVPSAAWSWDGMRSLTVGLAVTQAAVGAILGSAWYLWGENICRYDGKVMRLVDLDILKRNGSFFDMD